MLLISLAGVSRVAVSVFFLGLGLYLFYPATFSVGA